MKYHDPSPGETGLDAELEILVRRGGSVIGGYDVAGRVGAGSYHEGGSPYRAIVIREVTADRWDIWHRYSWRIAGYVGDRFFVSSAIVSNGRTLTSADGRDLFATIQAMLREGEVLLSTKSGTVYRLVGPPQPQGNPESILLPDSDTQHRFGLGTPWARFRRQFRFYYWRLTRWVGGFADGR